MLEIFERHVQKIRPSGSGQYKGLCPFHDDTKPSFSFSEEGLFKCFGCEIKGNAYQFAELLGESTSNLPNIEQTDFKRYEWSPPQEVDEKYKKTLSESIDRLLLNYDGFIGDLPWNKNIVEKLSIGWDDGFVFPYLNSRGDLVNIKWHKRFQVRGHAQTFIFPFWHMIHKYKRDEILYVTEGEKDCISMISQGKQAICFNNGAGTRIPDKLMELIQNRFDEVHLYYDDDEAGRKATANFLESYG